MLGVDFYREKGSIQQGVIAEKVEPSDYEQSHQFPRIGQEKIVRSK